MSTASTRAVRGVPAACSPDPAVDLELAARLGDALSRLVRVVHRGKAQASARSDHVELAAFRLLAALDEGGPMRATSLAGIVLSDPSTVSRQVGQLVSAGYVQRQPDPADRRANVLVVTAAGSRALAGFRQARNEHLAWTMRGWSQADRRRVASLVDRLATDLADHLQATPDQRPSATGESQERS